MTDIFHKKNRVPLGKVGLALGSGSSRGWAHIGVIKALAEAGVHIDYVAGTSIGAVVGAVYASGRIAALENVVLNLDWKKVVNLFDVVFPKSGLIDGNKIAEFLRSNIGGGKNIEDLSLPFCAVSTDLATGNEVVIQDGDIIEAVRASISVPGIFTPVRKGNMILVDGGLVNPVPVSVVRKMGADLVIAVDLNHDIVEKKGISRTRIPNSGTLAPGLGTSEGLTKRSGILDALNKRLETLDLPALMHIRQWMSSDPVPNILEVIMGSINIMEAQITTIRLKTDRPDLLIQPHLGHIRFLESNKAQEAIAEGYR
ncbi:MAG: patatin-like phospholipase family protein, partial [Deltaproteobacteria bacterium]|nr:patatin-like phospholipase family protein [Deltaproteobacteria bacterium]